MAAFVLPEIVRRTLEGPTSCTHAAAAQGNVLPAKSVPSGKSMRALEGRVSAGAVFTHGRGRTPIRLSAAYRESGDLPPQGRAVEEGINLAEGRETKLAAGRALLLAKGNLHRRADDARVSSPRTTATLVVAPAGFKNTGTCRTGRRFG
jgi:hypothetical protein